MSPRLRWSNRSETILGGLGGLAFGLGFILAIAVSLPISVNTFHNPPTVEYPTVDKLPISLHANIRSSQIMSVGYDTLLYKLFDEAEPLKYMHSSIDPDLVRALNRWLVIGTPWERTQLQEIENDENDT